MPYKIEDSHLVDIFITNLIPKMSFHMKMANPKKFSTLVKKGKNIENGLLEKGIIKHYNSSSSNNESNNNRKPKFWSKNKGVTHDGVTDVKNLQGGNNNNYRNRNNNNSNYDNQINQQSRNQTQFFPCNNNYNHDYDWNRKFTNFHEPLEAIFKKLVDHNLMVFPNTCPFDENKPKSGGIGKMNIVNTNVSKDMTPKNVSSLKFLSEILLMMGKLK